MKNLRRRIALATTIALAVVSSPYSPVIAQTASDNQSEAEAEAEAEVEAEVGDGTAAGAASLGASGAGTGDGSMAAAATSASIATSTAEPAPSGESATAAVTAPAVAQELSDPGVSEMVEAEAPSEESEIEAEAEAEAAAGNGSAVAAAGGATSGSAASISPFSPDAIDATTAILAESATDAQTSPLAVPYVDTLDSDDGTSGSSAMTSSQECEMEREVLECESAENDEVEAEAEAEAEAETEMGAAAAAVSGTASSSAVGENSFTDADISTAVSTSTSEVLDVTPPRAVGQSDDFEIARAEEQENLSSESEVELEAEAEAEIANNAAAAAAVASGGGGQTGDGASALISASTSTSTSTEADNGTLVRNNDVRSRSDDRVDTSELESGDADDATEAEAEAEASTEISDSGVPGSFTESDASALGDSEASTNANESRSDSFGSPDSRTPDQADFQLDTPGFEPFDDALAGNEGTEVEAEADAEAEAEVGFNAAAASASAVGGQARSGAGQMSGQALSATETNTKVFDNDATIVEDRGRAIDAGDETIPDGIEVEVAAEAEAEAEVGRGAAAAGAGAGFAGAPSTGDFAVSDTASTLFAAAAVAAAGPVTTFEISIPDGDTGTAVATATASDPDCGGVAVAVAVAGVGFQADGTANELEGEQEDECSASASVTITLAGASAIAEPGTSSFTAGRGQLSDPEGESESEAEVEVEAEAGNGVAATSIAVATAGRFPQVSTSSSTSTDDVGASIYVPITPDRVLDTRNDAGASMLDAGDTVTIDVADAAGVPETGVTAVAMYLTMVRADGRGFATAYPAGATRPVVSNVNTTADGRTRGNLVIVPVGADGRVNIYGSVATHITADIVGFYQLAIGQVEAGRTISITPERLLDTRTGDDPDLSGRVEAGETLDLDVLGRAGVPSSGVEAVIVTLTAAQPSDRGYVTAWSGDDAQPTASSLNHEGVGDVSANQTIVPVDDDGSISLFSFAETHLIADVTGYVTGADAEASRTGLFVALTPSRLFDTREEAEAPGPKGRLDAGDSISPEIAGVNEVPQAVPGVMLNITAVNADDRGFVTVWPADENRPVASTVNVSQPADVRAAGVVMTLGGDGDVSLYSSTGIELVGDVFGYLTN